jgi:hypothetical protein
MSKKLFQDINNHINAYQASDMEIPPFRATRAELKEMWPYLKLVLPDINE